MLLSFFELLDRLKHTKRTGWVEKGVPEPESIADHMYRMAMMALTVELPETIDRTKAVYMALVHDVAEAIVGDISPAMNIPKEEKQRREELAMGAISAMLPGTSIPLRDLWNEYEAHSTEEAMLVKELDLLDMVIQADTYEAKYRSPELSTYDARVQDLSSFFQSTAHRICRFPSLQAIDAEIRSRRQARLASQP